MKRSPGLRALSSEHHTGLVLARRAALTVDEEAVATAWRELAHRFVTELEPHFRQEEDRLLPAMAQAGETALVQRTLDEHARMRALIYDLPHNAPNLHAFAEQLQAHIRFEERELFAVAQARLPESFLEGF